MLLISALRCVGCALKPFFAWVSPLMLHRDCTNSFLKVVGDTCSLKKGIAIKFLSPKNDEKNI